MGMYRHVHPCRLRVTFAGPCVQDLGAGGGGRVHEHGDSGAVRKKIRSTISFPTSSGRVHEHGDPGASTVAVREKIPSLTSSPASSRRLGFLIEVAV